ncbi:protein phosphatase CheZ [Rhodopseudomonas palustris]|uniref:Protein phosphatase CheZ n=1 Tax=Rhodopseudomonas palustris TaxID=1076 RepID=A0AAX3E204_RHOPL|nr:protein phosphatase CheZ [Rhodopseudomonas palustris]AVT80035.1 chemotaxis protein CheZ [Rhodopseudomonas palustris]UYO40855.1 protein phosphatase CheZ [Rhodopseudomonas palustris]UYO45546.1 protein phosphatase CheZ [Rhodopseudomonas palustris]UYO50125.1 protein phosphatase CheZ [Rhodopseudomonas palustris]UYO54971.1 protein phosphatase CheZ [Rhodopseudomonas palustris]
MSFQRKRFRIEELTLGAAPMLAPIEFEAGPTNRDLMAELRAIRAQIVNGVHPAPATGESGTNKEIDASLAAEAAETKALLASYKAQVEQCEKLKIELDLIHNAIDQTKREIAVLHSKSFSGEEMAKVNGELGAVVGGTEEATQQILEAAEAIDQAATALGKVNSADQQQALSEEIQERVISIFEACNFQDLTGQRISKVMNTMKFIEHHIVQMMEIWGGVDEIKAHAPAVVDNRDDDAKLLNGPRALGEDGHASQDDIDAMFN